MTWRAYGLALRGAGLCRALRPPPDPGGRSRADLDVSFTRAPVPAEPRAWAAPGGATTRIGWGGEAEYVFAPGHVEVRTETETEQHAMLGLLLSALPLALPLFGLEPLHGCVVARSGRAVAALGHTGYGKSTLARGLARRGWAVLSDDVCAVDDDGLVWPGPPLLASRDGAGGDAVGPYDTKTVLPAPDHPGPEPVRLDALLLLDPRDDAPLAATALSGSEAFARVMEHVRAPHALAEARSARQLRVVAAAARLPVLALTHVRGRDDAEAVADCAVAALAAT